VVFLAGLLFVLIAHGPRVKLAFAMLFFRIQHPRRVMSDS
jgi:hypothetical protein